MPLKFDPSNWKDGEEMLEDANMGLGVELMLKMVNWRWIGDSEVAQIGV